MPGLRFVIVSGPPGSGKSTVAAALATHLGLPLLGKDLVKDALMAALPVPDVEASRRLGRAAVGVVLALARANGRGVLESNWRASVSADALVALPGPVIEVFCDCPVDLSRRRYREREGTRHPGHFDAARADDDSLWDDEVTRPMAAGWPVVRVDTTGPVDVAALVGEIRGVGSAPG